MAGNETGGLKTRQKMLERDPDFYKRIGQLGGKASKGGGFAAEGRGKDGLTGKERASLAGKVGGKAPKKKRNKED